MRNCRIVGNFAGDYFPPYVKHVNAVSLDPRFSYGYYF